jgi:membrane protein YdbS with pleckstrin-like domain
VVGSSIAWLLGLLGALLLGIAALIAFRAVWRWDRTRLVLTSEKLFVVYGIARRRAAAVRLSRVPALEWEQGPLGRVLGYGTLVAGDFEVPYVPARGRDLLG